MFIPTRVQFDEAIQLPKIRLKVNDPELKFGAVEMVGGKIPAPFGIQGGFAIVYKFKTQSGKLRALRVFTRRMDPDIRFRYEKMGSYFRARVKNVTAEFAYHEAGISVKDEMGKAHVFPLIEMEWVEGVDLLKKLDELCKKRDRAAIGKLVDEWVALLHTLRQAHIAHGDLSGDNVMVRPDGSLVLVGYDGVYIPDFAGRNPIVLGQEDYQHPDFGKRPFDEWMDEFSALVIYTSLLALHSNPELWDKYATYQVGTLISGNLLFKSVDFKAPNRSVTFQAMYKLGDSKLKALLDELRKACALPVTAVRFPMNLIDSEYEEKAAQRRDVALNAFRLALQQDRDEKIAFGYDNVLDGYSKITPAERQRHELALKRIAALKQVRDTLASGDEEKLVISYDPILDNHSRLTSPERQRIADAQQCVEMRDMVRKAITTSDDAQIVAAYDAKLVRPWTNFSPSEQQRINLAFRRTAAVKAFREALKTDDNEQIVSIYDSMLDGYGVITADEKKRHMHAKRQITALQKARNTIAIDKKVKTPPEARMASNLSATPERQADRERKWKSKSHPPLFKSFRALRVFLCHSSSDKPAVRRLYNRLNREGIDTWLDEKKLMPGQDWNLEITKAVRSTDIVLVCLSRGAVNKAGYVQKEIKYALDIADEQAEGTIFIIPLKLEECQIPDRLRRYQWLNFYEKNGYSRLLQSLYHRANSLGISMKQNTK